MESAGETETQQRPCGTGQALWSQVLITCFCFSPQLPELLSRTLLRLCPEHRPLWLQPTLLSFKDRRAVVSVARWLSSMFPGWPLVLTPLLSSIRKIRGQDGRRTCHVSTTTAPRVTWRNLPSSTFLVGGRSRGTRPDSFFYGL